MIAWAGGRSVISFGFRSWEGVAGLLEATLGSIWLVSRSGLVLEVMVVVGGCRDIGAVDLILWGVRIG